MRGPRERRTRPAARFSVMCPVAFLPSSPASPLLVARTPPAGVAGKPSCHPTIGEKCPSLHRSQLRTIGRGASPKHFSGPFDHFARTRSTSVGS